MSEQTILGRKGLVVGLPLCGRPVMPEWAIAYGSLNYPANMNVMVSALKGEEVGEARCKIAHHAIEMKSKYLFFLDDDTAPPYFTIRRLVYALEQADDDVMVAGGIYFSKWDPPEPMVFLEDGLGPHWRWKVGDVFPCASMGTGCMMIKTEVFQHLPEPWFKTVNECPTDSNQIRRLEVTDDLYFCAKVRAAGFKLLADAGVQCIHWDVNTGKHYALPEGSYPTKPREEELRAVSA